jgi:uncharacterized protein YlxW (UPF0749 family)
MTADGSSEAGGTSEPADAGGPGVTPGRPVSLSRALAFRRTRTQLLVGSLFCLLGFAAAVQVGSNREGVDLGRTQESDLVRILDDVNQREDRLQTELRDLQVLRDRLASGTDADQVALEESQAQVETLSILAGTVPAQGPGVVIRLVDPQDAVDASLLLDTIQELRDAGAEALQVGDQRVVGSTWFADPPAGQRGIVVNGALVPAPYEIRAIGDPRTLSSALRIPGGVVDSLRTLSGDALVAEQDRVEVTALQPPPSPQYARPAVP